MPTTEYVISPTEIRRRIWAFTLLLVSLYLSFCLLGLLLLPDLITQSLAMISVGAILTLLVLFGLRQLIIAFFASFLQTKLCLSKLDLVRQTPHSQEQFLLQNIHLIEIKRTTRGTIREMCLTFNNGKTQHIDGLEDFEGFLTELTAKTIGSEVTEKRENLDYDNPLFYPFLGILVSISITALTFLANLNSLHFRIFHLSLASCLLILSGYFILKKPLTIRYGAKSQQIDHILGFIFIGLALMTAFLFNQ